MILSDGSISAPVDINNLRPSSVSYAEYESPFSVDIVLGSNPIQLGSTTVIDGNNNVKAFQILYKKNFSGSFTVYNDEVIS